MYNSEGGIAMDDFQPVIVKINQQTLFNDGKNLDVIRLEYKIGAHGPFVENIAKKDFNAAKVQELMQATAQTVRALAALSGV